ncbi:MAG: DUF2279 domain-containing protein [Kofleriaceae bacterium]
MPLLLVALTCARATAQPAPAPTPAPATARAEAEAAPAHGAPPATAPALATASPLLTPPALPASAQLSPAPPTALAAAGPNPAGPSPWIDESTSTALTRRGAPASHHKLAASLTLAGIYAGFTTWTYFAWYRQHKPLEEFRFGCFFCNGSDGNYKLWSGDGWFGSRRYAGGADKLGHAWATMGLMRGGAELLHQWGGYDRMTSALVSSALAEALFFGVEVKDGFYYEFSYGDLTFNTLGVALGFALTTWPRLDEFLDYRVEYWPSDAYRAQFKDGNTGKNVNIAEDYSGETYMLALHLGAFHGLRDSKYGGWSRFVDVAVGFGSRGYKPEPPKGAEKYQESQHMYLGLSVNAQGIFDYLLDGRSRAARKITHGVFEVFNAPFGSLPVLKRTQRPSAPSDSGGA